jgi:excisionase family DNA binding protein
MSTPATMSKSEREDLHRGRAKPRFFTVSEIAESLDVSTRTVRRWIRSGSLIAHRFGGIVRVSEADFAGFLALRRDA